MKVSGKVHECQLIYFIFSIFLGRGPWKKQKGYYRTYTASHQQTWYWFGMEPNPLRCSFSVLLWPMENWRFLSSGVCFICIEFNVCYSSHIVLKTCTLYLEKIRYLFPGRNVLNYHLKCRILNICVITCRIWCS